MASKDNTSHQSDDPSSYLPGVSIDCVIIGFDLKELNILLLKLKESEHWSLPGALFTWTRTWTRQLPGSWKSEPGSGCPT
jgi:hypothetical protein